MKPQINTFTKITVVLLMVLIPLLILYNYSNRVSQKVIEKEIVSSYMQKLQIFANQLNANAEELSQISVTLLMDPDVRNFSNVHMAGSEYARIEIIKQAMETIQIYNNTTAWENQITLYSLESQKVISTLPGVNFDQVYLDEYVKQKWQYRQLQTDANGSGHFVRHLLDTISAEIQNAKLVTEVSFSSSNIRGMLNQYKSSGSGDPIFYYPGQQPIMNDSVNHALVETLISILDQRELAASGSEVMKLQGEEYLVQYQKSNALDWYLVDYTPLEHMMEPMNRSRDLYYMFAGILLLLSVAATLIVYRQVQLPLRKLVHSFQMVKKGFYSERIEGNAGSEFGFLFERFNEMTEQIQTLVEKVLLEELRSREANLKQLQSQINPHFLYNCLYFIKNAGEYGDYESVSAMAVSLGNYYRYTTKVDNPSTTVREELGLVANYLRIQNLRMSRLSYEIDIPKEIMEEQIPRLLIQPIVENAIIHGLEPKVEPGWVRITGEQTETENAIIVEDNGVGLTLAEIKHIEHQLQAGTSVDRGTGVRNVHQRLMYLFGNGSGLQLSSSAEGGLKVVLRWKRPNDAK